jgi:hypothetical protein
MHFYQMNFWRVMISFSDPRVSQSLVDRDPFFKIDSQHFPQKIFGVIADVLPASRVQSKLSRANAFVQPIFGSQKGQSSRKQDVEQDPCGPDVNRFPVGLSLDDFRCHEVRSSDPAAVHALAAALGFAWQLNGDSEPAQFHGGGILLAESRNKSG